MRFTSFLDKRLTALFLLPTVVATENCCRFYQYKVRFGISSGKLIRRAQRT